MKLVLLNFASGKQAEWFSSALRTYQEKISYFYPIEIKVLKSKSLSRGGDQEKSRYEDDLILAEITPKDFVIGFDEKGKSFRDSVDFSKFLVRALESQKSRIIFVIGGAYGLGEKTKARCDQLISLSPLTFNHLIAEVVALEQIYRAFSIWKNRPYHND